MTCKECIHYKVCCQKRLHVVTGMDFVYRYKYNHIERVCKDFKDRSRLVELPQSVHLCDAVHFVLKGLDEIDLQEYTFTVGKNAVSDTVQFITEIGTYGFWVGESPREFAPDYDDFYYWYELGETVFLSSEAAEQALKERENSV